MLEHVYLIPVLPLLAAVVIFFFGRFLPLRGAILGIAAAAWGLFQSSVLFFQAAQKTLPLPYEASFLWFKAGIVEADAGVLVDGLTIAMLVVVTLVSTLIQVYSIGYMHGDPRFKRYYAYLSLFTASMLGLVVADNMALFYVCWELVGVCSYFLISFWFEKPEAAYAGRKAFITTKLGDLGFFLGLLILFEAAGTFSITQLQGQVLNGVLAPGAAGLAALLFFFGAMGKSAQVPLLIWLPDAMEGPTPVSALIHAATMVAAGVYLVARVFFLYAAVPGVLDTVAWFGAITAFMAATMALVVYDIKRVLAFSTISQLGFMMLALGAGGLVPGMFHLTTHGIFKALLFLGAGSVIHAVRTNDMREMGGLRTKMPVTFWTFMAATLAIAGIPPFAGFFSKDAILAQALERSLALYLAASLTAGLTAFYMFRAVFMTFFGEPRDLRRFEHAHESPWVMTVPLIILGVLSLVAGWVLQSGGLFAGLIQGGVPPEGHEGGHGGVAVASTLVATAGIVLSYLFYIRFPSWAAAARQQWPFLRGLLERRYGLDEFFLALVRAGDALSRALFWFDFNFIDQLVVDGYGYGTVLLSRAQGWFDRVVVDGAVDAFGTVTRGAGSVARSLSTGLVQNYLLYIALATSLMAMMLLTR